MMSLLLHHCHVTRSVRSPCARSWTIKSCCCLIITCCCRIITWRQKPDFNPFSELTVVPTFPESFNDLFAVGS